MTEQAMLAQLLERLQNASSQTEKSAIVAEMAFAQLDPIAARIARRCVILRWFDAGVVQAFIDNDVDDAPAGLATEITAQLADLPFVEKLDWGLAYHEQTRAGLLEQAIASNPIFFAGERGAGCPRLSEWWKERWARRGALLPDSRRTKR